MFDPGIYGYTLRTDYDRSKLERFIISFEDAVCREGDKKLATELRTQLLSSPFPRLTKATFERLARWCKTDGIYGDGMMVAQRISELLFGRIIDRGLIGT